MEADDRGRRRGWANDQSLFAARAAWIFLTSVSQLLLGAASVFLIARLLGPESYGQFGLAQAWIGIVFAIGQFGMPAAMTFFAGRGRSLVSLERIDLFLTSSLSAVLIVVALIAAPILHDSFLRAAPIELLNLALVAVPCPFLIQFAAGILYARGANLSFNRIVVAQAGAMLVLTAVLVGVAGGGVDGALVAYLVSSWGAAVLCTWEVHRLAARPDGRLGDEISLGEFARYGIKLYPQNVTSFFSYRADVFLMSWLLASPAAPLGLYSLAVRIAEITFYVPNSISALLYPAISASDRKEADRLAPAVGRFTMLATVVAAAVIIVAGFVLIWVFLPAFKGAYPALVVLMPGILSLSLSKVLASYLSGLGTPMPTAIAASLSLVANVVLNILLIPAWGILGASFASLVSYTLQASMLLGVASRSAGVRPTEFFLPRHAEFDRLRVALTSAVGRFRRSRGAVNAENGADPQGTSGDGQTATDDAASETPESGDDVVRPG